MSNWFFLLLIISIPLYVLLTVIPITRTLRAVSSAKSKVFWCGILLFIPVLGVAVFHSKKGASLFEENVIAFIFPAIFVVILGIFLWGLEEGKAECRSVCEEQGYADIRYKTAGRRGAGVACYCLTKEEAEQSIIFSEEPIPRGKRVF